jgi:hypothetical protein
MKSYKHHIKDAEFALYLEAISIHESDRLDEFLSSLTGNLKRYYNFIKDLADQAKVGAKDIVELLKKRGVFDFFSKIRFSITRLFDLVKTGFKAYRNLKSAIAEFLADTKVVKWTNDKIKMLDEFLAKHPIIKKLTGIAIGAILIYIWLNMSFTGDFDYDFDQSTLIGALLGKFTLMDIFGGPGGVKLLTLFATGMLFSFPWPGPQGALFVLSLLYGLAKAFGARELITSLRNSMRTAK